MIIKSRPDSVIPSAENLSIMKSIFNALCSVADWAR